MKRLSQKQNIFVRHRFALLFFAYVLIYHMLVVNRAQPWSMNDTVFSNYCLDFSFGFASKLLPGAVFNFILGSRASRETAAVYATVVILVVFAAAALLLDRFVLCVEDKHRISAIILCLIFLSGGYTFSIFTKWLGIIDTGWLLITAAFLVCLDHRPLRFLIPVLFALALMIHFSALVFFLTLFSILLVHRVSVTEDRRERAGLWIVFAVSLAVSFGLFFFLILNETRLIVPLEEFHEKLRSRGLDHFGYQDYAFFRIWNGVPFAPDELRELPPSPMKFIRLFGYQLSLCFGLVRDDPVRAVIVTGAGIAVLAPAAAFIARFHLRRMKDGSPLRRFAALLMLLQFPFVLLLGLIFAMALDMTRYLTYAFMPACICLFAALRHEPGAREELFEDLRRVGGSPAAKLWFLTYFSVTMLPMI